MQNNGRNTVLHTRKRCLLTSRTRPSEVSDVSGLRHMGTSSSSWSSSSQMALL